MSELIDAGKLVDGKYLEYQGKPLVREGQTICYGDMKEKYILLLEIMSEVKDGDLTLPGKILIQVVESKDRSKIIRQGDKDGLCDAFAMGLIWLDMALKNG